jgi:hypothetical protein
MPAAKWLDERPALKEQASFAAASGSTDLIRSPVTGRTCHRAVSGGKINAGFSLCGKSPAISVLHSSNFCRIHSRAVESADSKGVFVPGEES